MDATVDVISRGLLRLGILQGELGDVIENNLWWQYFMHGLGHWLGMNVHDVGKYKIDGEDRPLQPGMVLTVEPGIYIDSDADVDPKWHGLGIRIEDDVVITLSGHKVLTGDVPKTIEEIEALIEKRLEARAAKDFAESDRIRDELASKGVALEDGPSGTTWRKAD